MNIGDIFLGIRADTGKLVTDVSKGAEQAAAAAATALEKGTSRGLGAFATGIIQGMGQQAFRAIETGISDVVNAIPDLIAQGQAYATTVHDIQELTGGTAESVSTFVGTLESLGIGTSNVTSKLGILATQVEADGPLWAKYGIATKDANGIQLDMITILNNARVALGNLTNASERDAVARKLLGRSGLEWIDFLKMSNEQADLLTSRLGALGLVMTQDMVDAAKKSEIEAKQLDLAFQGLGVTLFNVVGPIIRQVMSGIAKFVVENGATIRKTIADIVNAVLGLAAGLVGIDISGLSTFSDEFMKLGDPGTGKVGQLETSLADLEAQVAANDKIIKGATVTTKADTSAIDANIAAVDKQIEKLKTKDEAAERAFQREMGRLAAVYQAQLTAMDAAQAADDAERSRMDLARQLAAAQNDLRRAGVPGEGGVVDFAAQDAARQQILDIQAQQAAAAAQIDTDRRRKTLEDTKAYIQSIADLEASSDNKKALAKNLATRKGSLQTQLAAAKELGNIEDVARLTAEIEAIQTAETRTQAALRTASQQTELQKTKAALDDLRKSITSSIGGGTSAAVTTAIAANKELAAEIAALKATIESLYVSSAVGAGPGKKGVPPLGSGGGLAAGMSAVAAEWEKAGTGMRTTIATIVGAIAGPGGLIDTIKNAATEVGNLLGGFSDPNFKLGLAMLVGFKIGGVPGAIVAAAGTGAASDVLSKAWADFFGTGNPMTPFWPPKASGGLIPRGRRSWVGEAGVPEIATSLPGGGTWITPLASSGYGGAAPAVIRLEIGGRPLMDYIDENLAYRRRP